MARTSVHYTVGPIVVDDQLDLFKPQCPRCGRYFYGGRDGRLETYLIETMLERRSYEMFYNPGRNGRHAGWERGDSLDPRNPKIRFEEMGFASTCAACGWMLSAQTMPLVDQMRHLLELREQIEKKMVELDARMARGEK